MATNNYTVRSFTNYSGTAFSGLYGLITIEVAGSPLRFCVCDYSGSMFVCLNETGGLIKSLSIASPLYVAYSANGNFYLTRYVNTNQINVVDFNLNLVWSSTAISTTYVYQQYMIAYNPYVNLIYHCDVFNNFMNTFDLSITRTGDSFQPGAWGFSPVTVAFFKNAVDHYIIFGASQNYIVSVIQSSRAQVNSRISICASNYMLGMYIDQSSGHMFISCHWDKKVQLWITNGTHHYRTGYYFTTTGNPTGVTIDSYGRVAVAMTSPGRIELFTPPDYTYPF